MCHAAFGRGGYLDHLRAAAEHRDRDDEAEADAGRQVEVSVAELVGKGAIEQVDCVLIAQRGTVAETQ